ncbi:hypothetical protein [Amycolatopsis minnesotensis]|uniref:Uncharacterized protein n=1 Tax=Amycolatopsis minnesotensis TaxID=337894 RepID=A0ABN2SAR5_9PSEU
MSCCSAARTTGVVGALIADTREHVAQFARYDDIDEAIGAFGQAGEALSEVIATLAD